MTTLVPPSSGLPAIPSPPQRSWLRAWAEVRGFVGGHSAAATPVPLRTADGVELAATLLPGPSVDDAPAVVLLHGFAAHRRKPSYAWLADELATRATVLAVDLRGHGASGGSSGLGATEALDAEAAVTWLRERGHRWVAAVGASMGATSAANAVAAGVDLDALVMVSGPGWIELEPTTTPMRRMRRLWQAPGGRAALRAATGVTVDGHRGWEPPVDPADAVAALRGPLLVVHGDDDEWFPTTHAERIAAGGATTTLWREARFGHAEDGFVHPFGRQLSLALLSAQRTGTFPPRQELAWCA